jgi:hypothetical protein
MNLGTSRHEFRHQRVKPVSSPGSGFSGPVENRIQTEFSGLNPDEIGRVFLFNIAKSFIIGGLLNGM